MITTITRRLPAVVAAVAWLAVIRLGWAFFTSDLTFEYVASHSRRSAPWWYRIAGMWGGMEGSLLLFAAIVAVTIAIAAWSDPGCEPLGAVGGAAGVLAIALGAAWPFSRLDIPEVEGFGLTPILEHPAMAIHPPLLYLALACTLPPLLGARGTRRWILLALGLLTLAMTLGGVWSYVEQGWGGYWAWDPVENASLAPWLAAIVALHAGGRGRVMSRVLSALPGIVALAGSASSRSGAVPSVHSFAEAGQVGWLLAGLTAASVVHLVVRLRIDAAASSAGDDRCRPAPSRSMDSWQLVPALLVGAALTLIVLLTAVPLIGTIDGRGGRIDGRWFAVLLAPVATVIAGALVALAIGQPNRVPAAAWIAHVGILVMLGGIAGSSFDRSSDGAIELGDSASFAGLTVTNLGVEVSDGPYVGTSRVTARLSVDGHRIAPSIVAYPERGGILTETSLISRPWRDIQVVLNRADDEGRALIEVRTKPLVQFIWLGALLVVAGALLSRRRRRSVLPASSPTTH